MTWFAYCADVVMKINVSFNNPQLGGTGKSWIICFAQREACNLKIYLNLCANPLENALVNLIEQHI